MMSIEFLADTLNMDGEINFDVDFDKLDLNHDGDINADDCPYGPGSTEAKVWWKRVMEPFAKSRVTPELQEQHGDSIVGVYKGKPLIPGESGEGQGDIEFLSDKIRITQGLSYSSANKIAWKVVSMQGGG